MAKQVQIRKTRKRDDQCPNGPKGCDCPPTNPVTGKAMNF